MLIFIQARLAYLATPKTGSTAVETALRGHADIAFGKTRKHMTAQRYSTKVAPFLADTFDVLPERVAMMRQPLDQIRSWYRYRTRAALAGSARATGQMTFDDFVLALISDDPPEFAQIGSQFSFLTDAQGSLLVDHLFAYEAQAAFLAFMSDRLGRQIALQRQNVSPQAAAPLSPAVEQKLRAARAREFALYDRLARAGGRLRHP